MAKTRYVCQSCGNVSFQWLGKCNSCQAWNSFVEETESGSSGATSGSADAADQSLRAILKAKGKKSEKISAIKDIRAGAQSRWSTGIGELDRVLGGGAVEGAFVLIGGDPGIGKSTLLLQALDRLSRERRVLYVTGEESAEQVKLRAERLQIPGEKLLLATETNLEKILALVEEAKPDVLAIDSIQTMFTQAVTSAPGSVSQVREVGARLMHLAKGAGILTILVGHVTKDGSIAGPRVLEHMVDTVLYFEGGASQAYRILRAVKNRFGSTNEIGIFEMSELGLREVKNPSALFLAERPKGAAGTVAVTSLEGTRPVIVELQALASKSFLAVPRRTALGVDANRAALLLAVMEKKGDISLYERDIFINVVGGLRLEETSADLGIVAAVASSYFNKPVDVNSVFVGEVGLAGEIRSVARIEERLREAASLGFRRCYLPQANVATLKARFPELELVPLARVRDLFDSLFV